MTGWGGIGGIVPVKGQKNRTFLRVSEGRLAERAAGALSIVDRHLDRISGVADCGRHRRAEFKKRLLRSGKPGILGLLRGILEGPGALLWPKQEARRVSQFALSYKPRKTARFDRMGRDRQQANCDKILDVSAAHEPLRHRCGRAASIAAFASGR